MSHPSFKTGAGRRVGAAVSALTIAAAGIIALSLTSSGPASASVSQTTSTAAVARAADTGGDRADMRKALKAARTLDGQARKDAVRKVRSDAKAGKYGDKIEKRLDRSAAQRAAVLALLPDDLQADLKDLKKADKADRKAMRDDIHGKALAGGYGAKVKEAALKVKDFWK